MGINVTGLGQFTNYFTAPYLAGTYAFQTYDPLLANPYLNPFLLGQTIQNGQNRTGSLDQLIGRLAFGINNTNSAQKPPSGGGSSGASSSSLVDALRYLLSGKKASSGSIGMSGGLSGGLGGAGGSLGGGLFGILNAAIGGNPFNSTPRNGLFGLAPEQYPTANRLALFDPVYINSEMTERNSPLYGLILATGGLPNFLRAQLQTNA